MKNGRPFGNGANGRVSRKKSHISPDGWTPGELKNTPVLWKLALIKSLATAAPFANKRTLVVLHALGNLRAMMRAMMMLGVDPAKTTMFVKGYSYPEKSNVVAWLRKHGFEVRGIADINADYLAGLEAEEASSRLPLLVVEDGGYFATAIHTQRPSLSPLVLGAVEQTSRGIAKLLEAVGHDSSRILFPVVSVPDSMLKKGFEPPFIADGILLALTNLISRPLRHMRILVLGYGVIGKALVERLVEAGADVTVYDPQLVNNPARLYARFMVADNPVTAATGKHLIIGASGKESITPEVIDATSPNTYLASVSSDQREIAVGYLEEIAVRKEALRHAFFYCESGERVPKGTSYSILPDGRELYLLHDGQPLNFMGLGGMEDREADLVLSLIFASAAELAMGAYARRRGILTDAVDAVDTKYGIASTFIRFHGCQR